MSSLLWLAIPLVVTALTIAFLSWRGRERIVDPHDGVAERRRFNEAMKRSESRNGRIETTEQAPTSDPQTPETERQPDE